MTRLSRQRRQRYATLVAREQAKERAESGGAPISEEERRRRDSIRYGHDLEERAITAFCAGDLPGWFLRIRPATSAEDHSGIDLWVDTDVGTIPVQVKSSAERVAIFHEKHPLGKIAVIVLHEAMSDEEMRTIVLRQVRIERATWHKDRSAKR